MIGRMIRAWADDSARADIARFERALAEEKAEHEATRRTLRVVEAERDALADVHARDRERIRADISAYARQRAENEGPDDFSQEG